MEWRTIHIIIQTLQGRCLTSVGLAQACPNYAGAPLGSLPPFSLMSIVLLSGGPNTSSVNSPGHICQHIWSAATHCYSSDQ